MRLRVKKFFSIIFPVCLFYFGAEAIPIFTPTKEERNALVIQSPDEWSYRTFPGNNGLIGVFWPIKTSYNLAQTVIFVFLQQELNNLPEHPDNINLFTEKCEEANFRFASPDDIDDPTKSIGETYFSGRCGKTMALMKIKVQNYTVILALVSSGFVTKQQMVDTKKIALNYKKEIEKYIKDGQEEAKNSDTE